jgi:hypothetical protein
MISGIIFGAPINTLPKAFTIISTETFNLHNPFYGSETQDVPINTRNILKRKKSKLKETIIVVSCVLHIVRKLLCISFSFALLQQDVGNKLVYNGNLESPSFR